MSEPLCGCMSSGGCQFYRDTNANSDTRAKIDIVEDTIKGVGCDEIAALVIYDLPGRDCAAKASNGELAVGEIDVYKTEYIDRRCPTTSKIVLRILTFQSHCRHLQEVPQHGHCSGHRARFPAQLGHKHRPPELPGVFSWLQGGRRIRAQVAQPPQHRHVHRRRPRRMARLERKPEYVSIPHASSVLRLTNHSRARCQGPRRCVQVRRQPQASPWCGHQRRWLERIRPVPRRILQVRRRAVQQGAERETLRLSLLARAQVRWYAFAGYHRYWAQRRHWPT